MGTSTINMKKLIRDSKKNWSRIVKGSSVIGVDNQIPESAMPFCAFKAQINRSQQLISALEDGDFRIPIASRQQLEAKILFVLRYRWAFERVNRYPFEAKWIYEMYKRIASERDICNLLRN